MNLIRLAVRVILLMPTALFAYELGTHAYVTKVAVDGSVLSPLSPRSIVPVLGFERLDATTPFKMQVGNDIPLIGYFDNTPLANISTASIDASEFFFRRPQNQEGVIFQRLHDAGLLPTDANRAEFEQTIAAWVMRGAIREDDNDVGVFSLGDHDGDPWNDVFRAGRHFYDPINERALLDSPTCALFGCRRATEWAMGRTNVLTTPGTLDSSRENHFSWQDARDNYWWALTYNLAPVDELPNGTHGVVQEGESGYRKLRFATTLKAVGQVIHLVQDMAQPQHSRNDSHGPPISSPLSVKDGAFEAYTEGRLFRTLPPTVYTNAIRLFDGSLLTIDNLPVLRVRGNVPYPVPAFSTPVKFFTTQVNDGPVPARRGMADLSNRGFFTASTLPINVQTGQPDPGASAFANPLLPFGAPPGFYQEGAIDTSLYVSGAVVVKQNLLFAAVPDALAPNWNAQSGLFSAFGASGQMPLLTRSQAFRAADLIATPTPITEASGFVLSNEVFTAQADAMLPRAVAYSTGLIDYFFRGRLEVTPTAQKAFAVLNQGELHTMDAEGYPRRPDGRIFGFEKLRLKLRNVSEAITESGTPVGPALAQTSGDGVLVAVARYHRNTCYQPDLSGERISDYAPPPSTGVVTEPGCAPATTARTGFQEISVSAPLTIASVADLPGGEGTGGSAVPVEKAFDFSGDPIPVNATDLFIQVVYRGALGEEPDGIAVGNYDAREPAFVGIWNNTDYYWNAGSAQWIFHFGGLFPFQNVDFLRVCTGPGVDSRFAYFGEPVAGAPIMGVPAPKPGAVQLAILFAIPATPTQQFSVRVTPVMADATSAPQRSWFSRGAIHQASQEVIAAAALNAPQICFQNPTLSPSIWCQDPINRRRGLLLGQILAPVFYDTSFGNSAPDVDATPLPPFPGMRVASTGALRYDDAALATCPPPPTRNPAAEALIELLETAADLGIDLH